MGAALLAVLALAGTLPQNASAQGIVFLEVGERSLECPAAESVEYKWFLYDDSTSSYLIQLSIDETSGTDWSSRVSEPVFVLQPCESRMVTLTVEADGDVSSRTVNQSVSFTFTDLNGTSGEYTLVVYAETTFIPTWGVIAPGKNKLLDRFDTPLPAPLDNNYVTFGLNMCIWAGIALSVAYVVDPAVHMITKRTKTDIDDRILKILRIPIFVLIIIFGLVSSLTILPLTDREVGTVFEVYGIALIAILTFVVYKIFKEVLVYVGRKWARKTNTEIDDVLIPVIDKVGGVVILVFGAIATVNYLGYDITFLLAGVGVFGLVIAFAAQDALSNFFSGMALLLDRPFSEGDFITLNSGELCRVDKIGIRSTRLHDVFANNLIVLPNNKLVNDKLVNLDEPSRRAIWDVTLTVPYGSDIEKIEKILIDVARKHQEVLKGEDADPSVRLSNFGELAIEFKLFFTVDDFMTKWRVAHELRKEIGKRFSEERIEMGAPRLSVQTRNTSRKA
jgi:small-conductance mechanosensitive channel